MNVYLDGQPLSVPEPMTFAAALRIAGGNAERKGRVLVEVQIDGSPAPDALIDDPPNEPVGGEVRMISVEPRSLVRVTLMDAVDALEAARERQRRCADLIQTGKVEEALAPLSEAIQTWQTVRDAVEKSAAMLDLKLADLSPGAADQNMDSLVAGLSARLGEIRRSLAGEDWSALADVLAYDMGEQAEHWKTALTSAADGLRPGK
jgi:hypothetical protein